MGKIFFTLMLAAGICAGGYLLNKILDVGSSYNNRIENEMRPNGTSSKTLEDLSKH